MSSSSEGKVDIDLHFHLKKEMNVKLTKIKKITLKMVARQRRDEGSLTIHDGNKCNDQVALKIRLT